MIRGGRCIHGDSVEPGMDDVARRRPNPAGITMPFHYPELLARTGGLLKRTNRIDDAPRPYRAARTGSVSFHGLFDPLWSPGTDQPMTHVVSYPLRNARNCGEIYGEEIPEEEQATLRAQQLADFYREPVEVCRVSLGRVAGSVTMVDAGPTAPTPFE